MVADWSSVLHPFGGTIGPGGGRRETHLPTCTEYGRGRVGIREFGTTGRGIVVSSPHPAVAFPSLPLERPSCPSLIDGMHAALPSNSSVVGPYTAVPDDTACRPRALKSKGVCLLRLCSSSIGVPAAIWGGCSSKQDPAGPGSGLPGGAANFTVTGPQLERGEPSVG